MRPLQKLAIASAVFTAFAVLFFIFAARTDTGRYLHLEDAGSGQLLLRLPVQGEDTFTVSYIHSVNQSPVREIFELSDGRIVLSALEFYTFGAGIPAQLEPGQVLVHLPCGAMRIEGFARETNQPLRYMVGYTSELTLHLRGYETSLASLAEPGEVILIRFD